MNRAACLGAVAGALLLTGCAAAEGPKTVTETPPERPGPQDYASFEDWRADFRARALSEGIRPDVFDAAFAGVRVNARVLELDAFQPEFIRPIWEYLDGAVSDRRIADGRAWRAQKAVLLDAIEARYRVDREVVVAVWGLESAYGANYGDIPVIESLATLAYEGRRREFAETQLLSALRILQAGDVTPPRMVGSWAGAMGHTQFMPTSFEGYAVDFGGDGRRDLWEADAADALASTANYLARFGWEFGRPWGVEVRLPAGFDYALADGTTRRPPADWAALGVRAMSDLPQFRRHQALQQRNLLRAGRGASGGPDRRRRAFRRRLAARRATADPRRHRRNAGAADRAGFRHARRRRDRGAELPRRDPRIPAQPRHDARRPPQRRAARGTARRAGLRTRRWSRPPGWPSPRRARCWWRSPARR